MYSNLYTYITICFASASLARSNDDVGQRAGRSLGLIVLITCVVTVSTQETNVQFIVIS